MFSNALTPDERLELEALRAENSRLKALLDPGTTEPVVKAPEFFHDVFAEAQKMVGGYFSEMKRTPSRGSIEIGGERYLLMRASALSHEFFHSIKRLYADRGDEEAMRIGRNFLFDISHMIGLEDARHFHKVMGLDNPFMKLSSGPVHFAYTGWAFVEVLVESNPTPDRDFFLKYNHPYSFEADTWLQAGLKSEIPVCIMNAGYSSGWCEASFDVPLTAVEISCRAKGDDNCTFIMAHPERIEEFLEREGHQNNASSIHQVPTFFERKRVEEQLKSSLQEKEMLLKEVHHRVKNNLQIISSLLNLQSKQSEAEAHEKFRESIHRIQSMALIHETLYNTKDFGRVNFRKYLESLVESLFRTYMVSDDADRIEMDLEVEVSDFNLDKSIPCGLLINELVSNAFKYAFPDNRSGVLKIHLQRLEDETYNRRLIVADNGVGMSEPIDLDDSESLGMQLIYVLADQLDGSVEVDLSSGTKFTIDFVA